jgi:histidine triad (HIT) family protein
MIASSMPNSEKFGSTQRTIMPSCVFCDAIINTDGDALVYQDGVFGILMDQYPITTGHLLLFPIEHVSDVLELPLDRLTEVLGLAARLSRALKRTYKVERVGLFTAGKANPEHGHIHLLPLAEGLKKTFQGLSERDRPKVDRLTLIGEGRKILTNASLGTGL